MELRTLGRTGMRVSPFCLGAMMFGAWGGSDYDDAAPVINAALDAGINFVDTADVYSWGGSEEIVGRALRGRRDEIVLATKFHYPMHPSGHAPNRGGNSRRWIMRAVEDSLRRLGTDYIDIYQVHRPDPDTDLEETLEAMSDLVRSGKVRVIGTSTFPAEQLVEAQWIAQRRGLVRFRTEQPPYSILNRVAEAAVLPTCERYGVGVMTWSPLSEGWLTGRYQDEIDLSGGRQAAHRAQFDPALPGNIRKREAVERLIKLAAEAGCSLVHLALAFARAHPAVTSVILGPRTLDQLKDLLASASVGVDDELLDRIDEIVPPGTALNQADSHYTAPALAEPALRRRRDLTTATVIR
ncbi:aldo/keto reductase [Phytohabitans aurantiacus]|jgi:aryl-alcohol dehydrogenase-like predicted oxidoreductase|uniref:Aldo/keto reductase n=1 Tax=Phytohabitans aurantiacus TaxID=3016789 RepID=A0ABQ5R194_9ACTN|nr:aldo/keto reductase [Phytohabitans aurantiacus]GLH99957.1 aldo/keto reductase [Phytohabitans aurantiacus]